MTSSHLTPIDFDPFAAGELQRTAPATEEQEEIWTAIQAGGQDASLAYNQSISLRLRGPLDRAALELAVERLVARHEALRATFTADGTTLCVGVKRPVPVELRDLSLQPLLPREESLLAARYEEVTTPFDLERGPVVRFRLLRLDPLEHELIVTAHHLVCDGWSLGIIASELAALYSEGSEGIPADLPDPVQFGDHAARSRASAESSRAARNEAYWLAQYPGEAPLLDLPPDRPRPAERTFAAAREDFPLDPELVRSLRSLGKSVGASFAGTLLAAFEAFISRISGERAFAIGMPSAGQPSSGDLCLVGHCVHTLPIRADVDPEMPFLEHVSRVKSRLLDAFDHQEFTFGTLVKRLPILRDPSRIPLIPVLFNVERVGAPPSFAGLDATVVTNPRAYENFELFLSVTDAGDDVVLEATYNTHLFDCGTVQRRLSELATLLASAAADPETKITDLAIVPDEERAVLEDWGSGPRAEASASSVVTLFERQARRSPDAIAIATARGELTYRELDARANRLANHLVALGVRPDDRVGIAVQRGLDLPVVLLSVLKASATYVPLDPDFPATRLGLITDDGRLAALVTEKEACERLPRADAPRILIDQEREQISARSAEPPGRRDDPDRIAYVLHTSGSTGKPNGVLVPHGALVNLLESMASEPGIRPEDVLLAVTTLSFDISALELLLPLVVGAKVALVSREVAMDGASLSAAIERFGATVMQATPSTFRLLVEAGLSKPGLKVLVGGEALAPDLAALLLSRCGEVWNMYGPTETTIWSTCHRVDGESGPVPIGSPIRNTLAVVLDERRRPVPIGVRGELYIGGAGVAKGYLGRPDLTAERFITAKDVPWASVGTLYRTGDLVRWSTGGVLVFERRVDAQVKLRGHRIELGEIETVFVDDPRVGECVAMVREDTPGDVRLVAYLETRNAAPPTTAELRRLAQERLPSYMVPAHFVCLDTLPRTPNQKIDRKALPKPDGEARATPRIEPRSDSERAVASIWAELLGVSSVGVTDDFFALGGHSMLATRMLSRVRDVLGVTVGLRTLFRSPTVAAVAGHVDAALHGGAPLPRGFPERSELSEVVI